MQKIIIADDHRVITDMVKYMLQKDYEVFAAHTGNELIELYSLKRPACIIVDINMPGINGVDAIEAIRAKDKDVKIIVMTAEEEQHLIKRIMEMGINGYFFKSDPLAIFVSSVKIILSSDAVLIGPQVRDKLSAFYVGGNKELTVQEAKVARYVVDGVATKDIADRMFIAPSTVKNHRHNIMQKFKVSSALQLKNYVEQNKIYLG